MLCCIVLNCIVLCCTVLSYIVLYCIVLCYVVLCCIVLYCIALYCIALYGIVWYCIYWGQQELSFINAIQNRACRYFMGVSKYTPNAAVQRDMGCKTVGHRQKLCVLRLWLRLMNMYREMIASNVFWHSYTLAEVVF